eukprot:TRINITY_DN3844_c0_g1_i1.p1 TRINITY_DN3844_c0_g1~~TRINITY_DN3844_c0_g1_i1.p1  ORF type:complete len:406 (+),score=24.76 TRINITY_DN3844_c0_g1_i1:538-1755(+)
MPSKSMTKTGLSVNIKAFYPGIIPPTLSPKKSFSSPFSTCSCHCFNEAHIPGANHYPPSGRLLATRALTKNVSEPFAHPLPPSMPFDSPSGSPFGSPSAKRSTNKNMPVADSPGRHLSQGENQLLLDPPSVTLCGLCRHALPSKDNPFLPTGRMPPRGDSSRAPLQADAPFKISSLSSRSPYDSLHSIVSKTEVYQSRSQSPFQRSSCLNATTGRDDCLQAYRLPPPPLKAVVTGNSCTAIQSTNKSSTTVLWQEGSPFIAPQLAGRDSCHSMTSQPSRGISCPSTLSHPSSRDSCSWLSGSTNVRECYESFLAKPISWGQLVHTVESGTKRREVYSEGDRRWRRKSEGDGDEEGTTVLPRLEQQKWKSSRRYGDSNEGATISLYQTKRPAPVDTSLAVVRVRSF